MSSHRTMPKGRPSMDAFHADLIATRGATKQMLAAIGDMGIRGRADTGRLRDVAGLAGMVQRDMGAWADKLEGVGDGPNR